MPLGWIDFSKSEKNKVLSVLDMLSEAGTLDEIGIGPVRDGFANIFFPGTSTLQTRAKYFVIVPYALKDLEYSSECNPKQIMKTFTEVEQHCGEIFLEKGSDADGIIGSRALKQNFWVKRTPADLYWAGLRDYGIFKGGALSLTRYVRAMCEQKKEKTSLGKLGCRNDNAEEGEVDDKDAGGILGTQFWKIPTYDAKWMENLSIKLTAEEGKFLKEQIVISFPDSMMAYILRKEKTEVLECNSFQEMAGLIQTFPEQIQSVYAMAAGFSDFLYVLRTVYNIIVSDGKNESANSEWKKLKGCLAERAAVDLEAVFTRLHIYDNVFLCKFLQKSKELMAASDLEGMKIEIIRRERELKQGRAKTMHPGEFDAATWFGGRALDYRFGNAKVIMRDIFESEGLLC